MGSLVGAIVLAIVVAGCSPLTGETHVRSGEFPGVAITCGGARVLPEPACRAWGERLLRGAPDAGDVLRLVLTYRGPNARCGADFFDRGQRLIATAAAICPREDDFP